MKSIAYRVLARLLVAGVAAALVPPARGADPDLPMAYHGQLAVNGRPPDPADRFDLRLRLHDAATGGALLDEALAAIVATDTNGQFTVLIDAHPTWSSSFAAQWVELGARRSGTTNDYAPLLPRQRLTALPKALHASQADVATSFAGTLTLSQLPASVARLDASQTFTVPPAFMPASGPPFTVGMTTTVQQLSADLLDGLDCSAFWRRTAAGSDELIGPNESGRGLNLMLGTDRALRLQPGDRSPNLIGGSHANSVASYVSGATVAGGGREDSPNFAGEDQVTIGGGMGNRIEAQSFASFVGAGSDNSVGPSAAHAAIVGGFDNHVRPQAQYSFIGAGAQNLVSTQAYVSVIGGGQANRIEAARSTLVGGISNIVGRGSYEAFIGGGNGSKIEFGAYRSAILGGAHGLVRSNAWYATVLGGLSNVVGGPYSIAAGNRAKAEHPGSIVFADGNNAEFPSMRAHEFAVRASGGVRLETGGVGLFVDGERILPGGGGGSGSNEITAPFTLTDNEPGRSILRGVNESSTLLSTGVRGDATASTGVTLGVFGLNDSSSGTAVYGLAAAPSGVNYGVRGETESAEGYAGYFDGRVHIQGGTDAEPSAGGFLQIGASSGANLALDDNELMARNNGQQATLYLNDDGGNILLARNGTGRVGIGLAAPTAKLDVGGDIRCVALTLTSSRRFKTDIVPLGNALNRVNALRGVTYRWDDAHGGGADVGFVAEEVEPVLPEAVVREPDGQRVAGIKADRLTALTLEAIKELHQLVRDRDAEIALLRARLAGIERQLGLDEPQPPPPTLRPNP
jgi:hypothetical protein